MNLADTKEKKSWLTILIILGFIKRQKGLSTISKSIRNASLIAEA